ncbi:unnamed protein product [Alopecurus aequalis]
MVPKNLSAVLFTSCAVILALAVPLLAGDPDMLQDYCVADYKSLDGLKPPHTHPRATEIIFVLEGSLDVGFVTTSGRLFTRTVCKGELFVFPRGLLHFQRNNRGWPAAAISAFNSQLPGTQSLAVAMFGSSPPMPTDVLARALQIDGGMVEAMKSKFPLKY